MHRSFLNIFFPVFLHACYSIIYLMLKIYDTFIFILFYDLSLNPWPRGHSMGIHLNQSRCALSRNFHILLNITLMPYSTIQHNSQRRSHIKIPLSMLIDFILYCFGIE